MNHKEAIQAMLEGKTLQRKDNIKLRMYYNEVCNKFITCDDDDPFTYQRNINDIDFMKWEVKPWRAKRYGEYWFVAYGCEAKRATECFYSDNDGHYIDKNYFKTKEEAEAAVVALRKFWKEYRGDKSTI